MPQAIEPGTVIAGTYEITELLGKGGMGAVWAARHLRLPGKQVAIKFLLGGADDQQSLQRFRREAEIASRLGHPNIVTVQDVGALPDGTPYQILELLEGESLGARLRRGPIAHGEALGLVRQMGSALAVAHREGVVHRDLKPENIFLCPTDEGGELRIRVKVLDFGISKIRGAQTLQTQEQVLIGTPQYMAPEQAHGLNQSVDQRTDVFALGTIVYEMLSGRPAFAGDSVVSVILNVVQKIPEPLDQVVPGLPAGIAAAVGKAMAKEPGARFADVSAFVEALTGRKMETRPQGVAATGGVVVPAPLSHEEILGATVAPSAVTTARPESRSIPPAALATAALPGEPATGRGGRSPWRAAALGGFVMATVAGIYLATRPPPETARGGFVGPAVDALPPVRAPAGVAGADGSVEPVERRSVPSGRSAPFANERLPPEAEADLAAAEALLAQGDTVQAVRRAQHSLLAGRSQRAFAILTRAACQAGDMTNARASLQHLKGAVRVRVIRDCARNNLELD